MEAAAVEATAAATVEAAVEAAAAAAEAAVEVVVKAAVDEETAAKATGAAEAAEEEAGAEPAPWAVASASRRAPRLVLQSGPAQPCTQRHAPSTHAPRPVHAPGHSEAWHDGPPQPKWQAQRPVCGLHLPCPLQSPGQRLPSSTDRAVAAGSSAGAGEGVGVDAGGLGEEGDAATASHAAVCEPSGAEQSLPPQPCAQRQPPPPPHAPPLRHGYGQAGAAQARPP